MKTILILANSSGGLYDFRKELLEALLGRFKVVASLPDDVKTELLKDMGVEVVHTPINRRGMNPFQDLKLMQNYRALIRKYSPDLVLTYTIKPNVYGGFVCGRMGVPYISTVTGLGSMFQKKGPILWLVEAMYRAGLKKAACVFFQNRENLLLFKEAGIAGGATRLVSGSGVSTQVWQKIPYPEDTVVNFMFVGRVMREKGIGEFLDAARILHGEKVVFSIAGYCDEDWQEILDERSEKGEIVLLGFHPDMHELYAKCSAVVLPTYHEGMSNVLMEASACGRPVIASNISGCREIFEEGVTGFGFAPKSSEDLIAALRNFLNMSRFERAAMGDAARSKMLREFDRRHVVAAYVEEIEKAAGGE